MACRRRTSHRPDSHDASPQTLTRSSVLNPFYAPKHPIVADSTQAANHSSSDPSTKPAIIEHEEDHPTRHSPSAAARSRSYRGRLCKCVTGLTIDCAALCCCPFTLLHLLSLVLVRLPSRIVSKLISKLVRGKAGQHERRRRLSDVEEHDGPSPSPSWSYRQPPLNRFSSRRGFGDDKLWADYFDADRQLELQKND